MREVFLRVVIGRMMLVLCIDPHAHGHSHGGLGHSHHKKTSPSASRGHEHHNGGHAHNGVGNEPNGSIEHSPELATVETGSTMMSDYKEANINVRAAYIHAVGDLLQSVGVFIAAMVIYFVVSAWSSSFLRILLDIFTGNASGHDSWLTRIRWYWVRSPTALKMPGVH